MLHIQHCVHPRHKIQHFYQPEMEKSCGTTLFPNVNSTPWGTAI